MGLRARYDPKEDRMLLILERPDAEKTVLWVTRRQWLGLYASLGGAPSATDETKRTPPAKQTPAPPELVAAAAPLEGLRLKRKDGGDNAIGFMVGGETVGMTVKAEGLATLRSLLEQQAERAGWDAPAAVKRLKAQAAAAGAVRKAKG